MSTNPKKTTLVFSVITGGIAGSIAGVIGNSLFDGLVTGAITGGLTAVFFLNQPRDPGDPRVAVEAFSPAGLVGAVSASLITNAGWMGAFISSAIGWVIGLALPALLIAIFINDEK